MSTPVDSYGRPLRKVDDTRRTARDPYGFLLTALVGGSDFAIDHQERQGQSSLVNSDTLPRRLSPEDKKTLEDFGFKFLGESDDLFQYVEFPEGWKKERTDHSMWTNLVDPKGRVRANMFYKAAFYDREAFFGGFKRRYTCSLDYTSKEYGTWDRPAVLLDNIDAAHPKVIFTIDVHPSPEDAKPYHAQERAQAQMKSYITERFPDHENPLAYWDE